LGWDNKINDGRLEWYVKLLPNWAVTLPTPDLLFDLIEMYAERYISKED